jgi:hypothetical protein
MESSGMWYNIYECLRKRHLDVRLFNPAKTRAIASAKIKTDKLPYEISTYLSQYGSDWDRLFEEGWAKKPEITLHVTSAKITFPGLLLS